MSFLTIYLALISLALTQAAHISSGSTLTTSTATVSTFITQSSLSPTSSSSTTSSTLLLSLSTLPPTTVETSTVSTISLVRSSSTTLSSTVSTGSSAAISCMSSATLQSTSVLSPTASRIQSSLTISTSTISSATHPISSPSILSLTSTTRDSIATSGSNIRLIGQSYPGASSLNAPQTFSWAATGATAMFVGSRTVTISLDLTGSPVFKILINGNLMRTVMSTADLTPITGLNASEAHTVSLIKLNGGYYGTAVFSGFAIDSLGKFMSPPTAPTRRLEVIGDSLSNGYGDLGANADCAAGPGNEDATQSFGAVAAQKLGAKVSIIASQGWGMYSDYQGNTANAMPVIYGEAIWNDASKPWDFAAWVPDVIIINLGTNDFYQMGNGPANFLDAYTAFLTTIQSHYPSSHIICAINPVFPSTLGTVMNGLIQVVVANQAASGDNLITFLNLDTTAYNPSIGVGEACQQHPNIAAQAAIGAIVASGISAVTGW